MSVKKYSSIIVLSCLLLTLITPLTVDAVTFSTITCSDNFVEGFNGVDSEIIENEYWSSAYHDGTSEYYNNKARVHPYGDEGFGFGQLTGPWIEGDFEITGTISDIIMPNTDPGYGYSGMLGFVSEGSYFANVGLYKGMSGIELRYFLLDSSQGGYVVENNISISDVNSVDVKITKNGNYFRGFYNLGEGWISLGGGAVVYGYAGGNIALIAQSGYVEDQNQPTVSFDNISVGCLTGSPVITCEDNFTEDFTGTDGVELDDSVWNSYYGYQGKYKNNKAEVRLEGVHHMISSTIEGPEIEGDFELVGTVSDFVMPVIDGAHQYSAALGVHNTTILSSSMHISRNGSESLVGFTLYQLGMDQYDISVTIADVSSIDLKITRIGNVFSGYYNIGDGWVMVGSIEQEVTQSIEVIMAHGSNDGVVDSSVSFDDISVGCMYDTLGSTITTPAMVEFGGDLYVFKTGSDNSLKMKLYDGTTWGVWELVGYTTAPPTAVVLGTDLYIAKKGIDGSVKVKSFNGTVWTEWTELGGVTLSNPVLSTHGSNLYISKRGALNELKIKSFNGTTWSNWEIIGYSVSPPSMMEYSGDFYLVKRGIDQSLKVKSYDGSTWTGWTELGGMATSTPVAEVYGVNLYVAKKGSDNNIRIKSYDGTTWTDWTVIGSTRVSPGMTSFNGNLYVAKNGEDGSLRLKSYDGTSWGAEWSKVGDVEFKPVILEYNAALYTLWSDAYGDLYIQSQ